MTIKEGGVNEAVLVSIAHPIPHPNGLWNFPRQERMSRSVQLHNISVKAFFFFRDQFILDRIFLPPVGVL